MDTVPMAVLITIICPILITPRDRWAVQRYEVIKCRQMTKLTNREIVFGIVKVNYDSVNSIIDDPITNRRGATEEIRKINKDVLCLNP